MLPYESFKSPIDYLVPITSWQMQYPSYRDDPVFPARTPIASSKKGLQYYNNTTSPGIVVCLDDGEVCDAEFKNCEEALQSHRGLGSIRDGVRAGRMTDNQLARALLLSSLAGSACSGFGRQALKAQSLCDYLRCYDDFPTHQWRVEARRWFEASLARIQLKMLYTVRGINNNGQDYDSIVPEYRDMCGMGKFKSVGWRNVSVVGFLGLLLLASVVTLASIRAKNGDLWITLCLRALTRYIRKPFR